MIKIMLTLRWPSSAFSSKRWLKESFWSGPFWFPSHKNKKWMMLQGTAPATAPTVFRAAVHNHLIFRLWAPSEGSSGLRHPGRWCRWKAGRTQSECFYQDNKLPVLFLGVPSPPHKKKRIRSETRAQYTSADTNVQWNLASLLVPKRFPDTGKLEWSVLKSRHMGPAAKFDYSRLCTTHESGKYRLGGTAFTVLRKSSWRSLSQTGRAPPQGFSPGRGPRSSPNPATHFRGTCASYSTFLCLICKVKIIIIQVPTS